MLFKSVRRTTSLLLLLVGLLCTANFVMDYLTLFQGCLGLMAATTFHNNNTYNKDGGCGVIEDVASAKWVPYNDQDLAFYDAVEPCVVRLDEKPYANVSDRGTLSKLQCESESLSMSSSPRDDLVSTLARYDRVAFIGDSILRQQYFVLVCSVDPTVNNTQIVKSKEGEGLPFSHYEFSFVYGERTTKLSFRYVGFKLDRQQTGFFRTHYPDAVLTLSRDDAIVLNAGAHYATDSANHMERAVSFLARKSKQARASVFYMEPHNEEWPTRNGLFTKPCRWRCECEPIDEARLEGLGALSDRHANYSEAVPARPHEGVFQRLYPESNDLYKKRLSKNNSTLESSFFPCIPDCSPSHWKVDLARHILDKTRHHRLRLVPVYWQLVTLGLQQRLPTSRMTGDCVHKDIRSVLFMNRQLIRSMKRQTLGIP